MIVSSNNSSRSSNAAISMECFLFFAITSSASLWNHVSRVSVGLANLVRVKNWDQPNVPDCTSQKFSVLSENSTNSTSS
jgi:hypothetical protein